MTHTASTLSTAMPMMTRCSRLVLLALFAWPHKEKSTAVNIMQSQGQGVYQQLPVNLLYSPNVYVRFAPFFCCMNLVYFNKLA